MADTIWHPDLPTMFRAAGFKETPEKNTIDNPVDSGPDMSMTDDVDAGEVVEGSMRMTLAQKQTFKQWWKMSLGFRSLPFDSIHPSEGYNCEIRVLGYHFTAAGPDWICHLKLLVLP